MGDLEVYDLSLVIPGRHLLKDLALQAAPGESIAIMGPSGSGKTSLLNCLSGITTPTSGSIFFEGVELTRLRASARAAVRLKYIGLVFQFGELLPELTIIENVSLPLRLLGVDRAKAERRAIEWLARVGLSSHGSKHPNSLSGGELQRAGVARALSHSPSLVLADEPTGALDEVNAMSITSLLIDSTKETRAVLVVATHDPAVAQRADRVLELRDGHLRDVPTIGRKDEPADTVDRPGRLSPTAASMQP